MKGCMDGPGLVWDTDVSYAGFVDQAVHIGMLVTY